MAQCKIQKRQMGERENVFHFACFYAGKAHQPVSGERYEQTRLFEMTQAPFSCFCMHRILYNQNINQQKPRTSSRKATFLMTEWIRLPGILLSSTTVRKLLFFWRIETSSSQLPLLFSQISRHSKVLRQNSLFFWIYSSCFLFSLFLPRTAPNFAFTHSWPPSSCILPECVCVRACKKTQSAFIQP